MDVGLFQQTDVTRQAGIMCFPKQLKNNYWYEYKLASLSDFKSN